MLTRDSLEAAYCFFHQKYRVYEHSQSASQRDDIEYAIASYVEQMSPELYRKLAADRNDFLLDHTHFARDLSDAIHHLESMLDELC